MRTAALACVLLGISSGAISSPQTPLQRIRAEQRKHNQTTAVSINPISALVVECYWLHFESDDLDAAAKRKYESVVLFSDCCGYHTFYDFDRDNDNKPRLIRRGSRKGQAVYRPVTLKENWLEIWLEKVHELELARAAFERIDWEGWEKWRLERKADEAEAVAEALKEEGISFTLQVMDVSPLYDAPKGDKDPRPIRYADPSDTLFVTTMTYETLREALDHQWNILGRAFSQNATHLGADLVIGDAETQRLPHLPAGSYEAAINGPCTICGSGPLEPDRWLQFGPEHLPLPVQY